MPGETYSQQWSLTRLQCALWHHLVETTHWHSPPPRHGLPTEYYPFKRCQFPVGHSVLSKYRLSRKTQHNRIRRLVGYMVRFLCLKNPSICMYNCNFVNFSHYTDDLQKHLSVQTPWCGNFRFSIKSKVLC